MIKKIKKYIQNKIEEEGLSNILLWELIFHIKVLFNLPNFILSRKKIRNYLKSHDKIKLHIGCGNEFLKGFLNTDILGKIPINISKKLPFPKESVDLIYSNQVIEHIYHKNFKFFLKESYRILKTGGMHIITTPSIKKIMESIYCNNKTRKQLIKVYSTKDETLSSAVLINRISRSFMHKFLYDFDSIRELGKEVGFRKIFIVSNKKIPDETIKKRILELTKGESWLTMDLISETYILNK